MTLKIQNWGFLTLQYTAVPLNFSSEEVLQSLEGGGTPPHNPPHAHV